MEEVVRQGADLGLAFDGDADRLLAVDNTGKLVDGDQLMVICACHLKSHNRLPNNTVAVTVASNMGLHLALKQEGINVLLTDVGDKYVLEKLLRKGGAFGGEQSGHILFLEHSTTGDGLIAALQLLEIIKLTGRSLADLAGRMELLPQKQINVPVRNKERVMASPVLKMWIKEEEALLAGQGRILVRPSGTESLVRVMAEGREIVQLEQIVARLAEVIAKLEKEMETE